jgi:hypothetical protein
MVWLLVVVVVLLPAAGFPPQRLPIRSVVVPLRTIMSYLCNSVMHWAIRRQIHFIYRGM